MAAFKKIKEGDTTFNKPKARKIKQNIRTREDNGNRDNHPFIIEDD